MMAIQRFSLAAIFLFPLLVHFSSARAEESDAQLYRKMLSCYQDLADNVTNSSGLRSGDKANSFFGPGKMGQPGTVLILPGTHQGTNGRQDKGVFVLPLDTLDQLGVQAAFASTSSRPPAPPGVTLTNDDPDVQYEFQIKNGKGFPINFKYIQHSPLTDRWVGNCTLQSTFQAPTSSRAKVIQDFEFSGPEVLNAFVQEITRRVVNDYLIQQMTGPIGNLQGDIAEKKNDSKKLARCEEILSDKRNDPDFKALFAAFDNASPSGGSSTPKNPAAGSPF